MNKSLSIKDKLFQTKIIQDAKTILFFSSFDGEVDTTEMISQARTLKKRIALPHIKLKDKEIIPAVWNDHDTLEEGPYGIKQPQEENQINAEELDVVVVPALAYDKNNHRLGRGAGFYDRFLGSLPDHIPTIGLAFDFQCVETIPELSDHDIPVTHLLTN